MFGVSRYIIDNKHDIKKGICPFCVENMHSKGQNWDFDTFENVMVSDGFFYTICYRKPQKKRYQQRPLDMINRLNSIIERLFHV